MTNKQMIITFAVIWVGTVLTRFLPYIFFPEGKKVPEVVQYLGKVLGPAVFGLLVVYCLRNTDITTSFADGGTHGIPELISTVVTLAVFRWKRQMILSMAAGTVCYMILVQLVFA